MKILAIKRDKSACHFYRIEQPIVKIKEHGLADCRMIDMFELDTQKGIDLVIGSDIILIHGPRSVDWMNVFNLCQKYGKLVVSDYDDNPFETSPWNPFYRYVGTKEYKYKWPDGTEEYLWKDGKYDFDIEKNIMLRDKFRMCFKRADLVTTTTDVLKDELKKINPNTVVLPNLVNFDDYPICDIKKTDEVRIGWLGGTSHYEDLHFIKEPLRRILDKYDNVKFVYCGDYRVAKMFKDFPEDKIEIHDWVSQPVYPYKLVTLNLDIGLCPIVDNVFNRNKSAIKYFEYSVVKAASVVSDYLPYSNVVGDTALKCKTEDDWFKAMSDLIEDGDKRKKLGCKAYDNVYENHNIDTKVHLWVDEYKKLLKKDITDGNDILATKEPAGTVSGGS